MNFQEVVHSPRPGNAGVAKPQRFAEDRMNNQCTRAIYFDKVRRGADFSFPSIWRVSVGGTQEFCGSARGMRYCAQRRRIIYKDNCRWITQRRRDAEHEKSTGFKKALFQRPEPLDFPVP